MLWFGKTQQALKRKETAQATTRPARREARKMELTGPDLQKWLTRPGASMQLPSNVLTDRASFYKNFFGLVARYYPTASNATWIWTYLCATKQTIKFIGGEDGQRRKASEVTAELLPRLAPLPYVKGGGLPFLVLMYFRYLFTYGRFAGDLELTRDASGVGGFTIGDPFKVKFTKDYTAYRETEKRQYEEVNRQSFYYYGLEATMENPYGEAMLEAAWNMMRIAEDMLQDMRLSSSNAGLPRLHIKITQPVKADHEDDELYRSRVAEYFDATVDQLAEIGPDDNFYTWDDVQIGLTGGQHGATGFVWRNNRGVLDEEIIGAYHLYPWVVGRSFSTTKNWVRSQYDILMSQIESLQNEGSAFVEWIVNTNLLLNGITDVKVKHGFTTIRDPFIKEMAIAERFRIANTKTKILMGTITPEDGARELGYDKAADPKRIFKMQKEKEEPVNKDDNTLEIRLEEFGDQITELTELVNELAGTREDSEG